MRVGPTVLTVTNGNGAPARCTSSKKMNCSMALAPPPPNSFGQPSPSHPSAPIRRKIERARSPASAPSSSNSRRTSSVINSWKYARSSARSASCSGVYRYRIAQNVLQKTGHLSSRAHFRIRSAPGRAQNECEKRGSVQGGLEDGHCEVLGVAAVRLAEGCLGAGDLVLAGLAADLVRG